MGRSGNVVKKRYGKKKSVTVGVRVEEIGKKRYGTKSSGKTEEQSQF